MRRNLVATARAFTAAGLPVRNALIMDSSDAAIKATDEPRVAVLGAGAAGLACARVLTRAGYQPTVLEKDSHVGGVWKYVAESKDRPMYRGLRTNLPKEIIVAFEAIYTREGFDIDDAPVAAIYVPRP